MAPAPEPDLPLLSCACDEGEICRVCLADRSGLLLAAHGGDGTRDLETMFEREQRHCVCAHGEICRYCVDERLQNEVCRVLGRPWRDRPELRHILPSMWLAATAPRN